MIVMGVLGLLFVCYLTNAGNLTTLIDSAFGAQVHNAHTHDAQVTYWFMALLPYVAMAMCVAVLYVVLASAGIGKSKPRPRPVSDQLTIHEFAEIARLSGVGNSVAREMYRILCPDYEQTMRSTLTRTFTELGLPPEIVWAEFEQLVRRSGGIIRGRIGIEALGTPIEMMQAAEQCHERAALERRAQLQSAALAEERHRTVVPLPATRS
jgi:hypothetical protein